VEDLFVITGQVKTSDWKQAINNNLNNILAQFKKYSPNDLGGDEHNL
jgi:hypothetical protein